jgi:D-alanyl-D-alanine carboxypeptidase
LLWNYDGAIGGKTGYTHAALKCFVGAVQRNGTTLIVAILGARDQWGDTKRLLEFGFDHYDLLKGAPGSPGKAAAMEQQVGVRADRMAAIAIPVQEKAQVKMTEGFILQVGSFRDRERAEALSRQISDKDIDAFVEKTAVSPTETTYRVRVGPYSELTAAQETAQQILTKSGYRALILPLQIGREEDDPS